MPDALPFLGTLERIQQKSADLASRGTAISEMIELIDARLRALPGKIAVEVSINPQTVVGFSKSPDWCLWVLDADDSSRAQSMPLVNAPMKTKARVFPYVLQLLERMEEQQEEQLEFIEQAEGLLKRDIKEAK